MYWLELNYKKIFKILDDFKPDVILDLDNAELQRTILTEVAYKRNIPYMTVEYGKYGYYKYPSFQNAYGIDPYVKNLYDKKMALPDSEMQEAIDYIDWKQQFYDDVLSGKTKYYSNLLPDENETTVAYA